LSGKARNPAAAWGVISKQKSTPTGGLTAVFEAKQKVEEGSNK
jgi:hypothetical protein